MIRFARLMHSRASWSFLFSLLVFCLPAAAQESAVSAPLTPEQVIARVVAMNGARAKALATYSSVRTYHLECHCIAAKNADMVVRVDYRAPNNKNFSILSESGSGTVRHKVFRKLLEAEQESMQEENERRSALTPDNYSFRLLKYEKTPTSEIYVLEAKPRHNNKFLFRGQVWVDANDFAITRVEGEPAVNPSFWTRKTDFTRTYQRVGQFWLPEANHSVTKVRIFGTAELTIQYGDYEVTHAPATGVRLSELKAPIGQ
jgi:outer membrane lipoprotein-sorting protein